MVATRAREKMCAVNVSVEAVIASGPETLRSSQVGDAWRPWDVLPAAAALPPLGRVRHADPGFFDLFPPTSFPPVRQAIPAWPQKSGAALDAFPPIFRGADTRTHHRIRAGRSDAGICCRRGTADRHPTSPPTRRRSVLVLGGRRPQTGLRVLRSDRVDQRVWQSQTTRPLRF